jgi:hypothetical protein
MTEDEDLPPALARKNAALDAELKVAAQAPEPAAPTQPEPNVAPQQTIEVQKVAQPPPQITPNPPQPAGVSQSAAAIEAENRSLREQVMLAEQRFRTSEGRYESQHTPLAQERDQLASQFEAQRVANEAMQGELNALRQEQKRGYTDFVSEEDRAEFGADAFSAPALEGYMQSELEAKNQELSDLRTSFQTQQEQLRSMDTQLTTLRGDVTSVIPDFEDVNDGRGEWAMIGGWGSWLDQQGVRDTVTEKYQAGDWYAVNSYVNAFKAANVGQTVGGQLQDQVVPGFNGNGGTPAARTGTPSQSNGEVYTKERFDEYKRAGSHHAYATSEACAAEEAAQTEAMRSGLFEPSMT